MADNNNQPNSIASAGDKVDWDQIKPLYTRLNTARQKFEFSTVSIPTYDGEKVLAQQANTLKSLIEEMQSHFCIRDVAITGAVINTSDLLKPSEVDKLSNTITNIQARDFFLPFATNFGFSFAANDGFSFSVDRSFSFTTNRGFSFTGCRGFGFTSFDGFGFGTNDGFSFGSDAGFTFGTNRGFTFGTCDGFGFSSTFDVFTFSQDHSFSFSGNRGFYFTTVNFGFTFGSSRCTGGGPKS